jgi:hypothetical protein
VAMDTIALQADSLGTDDGGIGGIITSISEPLGGMGLAFSSSLFGLSGSLVVGFFNYACGQAQDDAIEDFSRWIDEHIPQPGSEEEALKNSINAGKHEEQDGAEGVAHAQGAAVVFGAPAGAPAYGGLDEHVVSQMLYTLKQSTDANVQMSANFKKLLASQTAVYDVLEKEALDLAVIREAQGELNAGIQSVAAYSQQSAETQLMLGEGIHAIANHTKQSAETQVALGQDMTSLVSHAQENLDAHKAVYTHMEHALKVEQGVYNTLVDGEKRSSKAHLEMREDLSKLTGTLERSNKYFSTLDVGMKKSHAQELRLLEGVLDIKGKIPKTEYEVIGKACSNIAKRIDSMNVSLQDNVKVMTEVAKEGNMQKMSRLLKEMQVFWMQMKLSALDTQKKKPNESDVES